MCLEAPGYARVEGWVTYFLDLTAFQGIHALVGLRPGMDPRLPSYMRAAEFFVVPP